MPAIGGGPARIPVRGLVDQLENGCVVTSANEPDACGRRRHAAIERLDLHAAVLSAEDSLQLLSGKHLRGRYDAGPSQGYRRAPSYQ